MMPLIKTGIFFSCHLLDDIRHEAVLIVFLREKHKCTIVWPRIILSCLFT